MSNKEIDNLWDKVQIGNEKAFDVLFRELYPSLCTFAYRLLNNLEEAEETVQDAFVNLWQNRNQIHIKGSIKSYLYQTVHN
ncbi:MAG TPA: sigma factor, partial [Bacteroidales bacterium]